MYKGQRITHKMKDRHEEQVLGIFPSSLFDRIRLLTIILAVAPGSGTSGTSLVPFYFESLEFFV